MVSEAVKGETVPVETTADAYLEILARRGVKYFFANAGTDFAPILESFAKRQTEGREWPRPILCPHETTAVGMAYGYYMTTGEPQVVMVHVNVGTANASGQIINASRSRIPMLFSAGRTPITEEGVRGGRNVHIHWAQESFDQAGMIREYVKWDYELRNSSQLETVVDRALGLAMADPPGPVYLTLPRELLAEPQTALSLRRGQARFGRVSSQPHRDQVEQAAELLAGSERPLIITSDAGEDPSAVSLLVDLAETGAIPVIECWGHYMNFPTDHELHLGFEPDGLLQEADVILVLESDVPWMPNLCKPSDSARVIQMGRDPYYSDTAIRGYPMDVILAGDPVAGLRSLTKSLAEKLNGKGGAVEERRERCRRIHEEQRVEWAKTAERVSGDKPIDERWLSACVNEVMDEDTIVVNEYDLVPESVKLTRPGSFFAVPNAGALGWALGASLGVKLARPEQTVIAAVGDGSYIFNVPTAAHFVARAADLPILTIVFNNHRWNAVKKAATALNPDGWATGGEGVPLSELRPSPAFDKMLEAHDGYGERVDEPAEVLPAIQRALRVVREEGRQALLNVICAPP